MSADIRSGMDKQKRQTARLAAVQKEDADLLEQHSPESDIAAFVFAEDGPRSYHGAARSVDRHPSSHHDTIHHILFIDDLNRLYLQRIRSHPR